MSEKIQILNQTLSDICEHFDTEEFLYRYLISLKEHIREKYQNTDYFDEALDAIIGLFEVKSNYPFKQDNIDKAIDLVCLTGVNPEKIMHAMALMTEQFGGIRVLQETYVICKDKK